jgi:uncharacterized protein YukE
MDWLGDIGSIERVSSELDTINVALSGSQDNLSSGVSQLVPASWEGDAAGAFKAHWTTESSSLSALGGTAVQIASTLDHLALELRHARDIAQQAEDMAHAAGLIVTDDGAILDSVGAGRFAMPLNPSQQLVRDRAQAVMDSARSIANTARSQAYAALAGISVPQVRPGVAVSDAERWAHTSAPGQPGFGDWLRQDGGRLTSDLAQIGLGGLSMDGGIGLIGLGGAGEVGGVGLDATGAGAVFGVPLNMAGAGAIVLGGGLVIGGAVAVGHGVVDAAGSIVQGIGTLFAAKQRPAELSPEERQAIENRARGEPYDQQAYNRAQQKIKQAEKYSGQRNKQKRKST